MTRSLAHFNRGLTLARARTAWAVSAAKIGLEMAIWRADQKGLQGLQRQAFVAAHVWFANEVRLLIEIRYGVSL